MFGYSLRPTSALGSQVIGQALMESCGEELEKRSWRKRAGEEELEKRSWRRGAGDEELEMRSWR